MSTSKLWPASLGVGDFHRRLVLCSIFVVAIFSYTWANQFPYFYHSDEESKALQLLYGYRNYWHPMLMLNATRLIARLIGIGADAQGLTMIGRYLSALFSSVGVVCFVQLAWRRHGSFCGLITGFLLLTLPLLFEVSHYCKEDPGLFMGLACTLLAVNSFWEKPDRISIILLSLATGFATSVKYPGVLLIIGVIPVIIWPLSKVKLSRVTVIV